MGIFRRFLLRLVNVVRPDRGEPDLTREVASHLRLLEDEFRRRGLSEEEAKRAAKRAFGGIEQAKERQRDARSFMLLDDMRRDLHYAVRMLVRARRTTLLAVFTFALGIGVNTAVFSVLNAVLLNPLPYPTADRLVSVYTRSSDGLRGSSSYPNFLDWSRYNESFSDLAAFRSDSFDLTGLGQPERVRAEMISASLFPLLGVQPLLGRLFTAADDQADAAPVALLAEPFWVRKFGSSPNAIGRSVTLSGRSYDIVGVLPASFEYYARNFQSSDVDVYVPIGAWNAPDFRDRKVSMGMDVVGRLRSGVTMDQATADMQTLARSLAEQYPVTNKDIGISLVPLRSDMVGPVRPLLILLSTAVLFVLLIAGVNVTNLLIARSGGRRAEVAIRAALGATRPRIVRQLLTESVLLSLAGGALGGLIAFCGTGAALRLLPGILLPRADDIHVDARVLVFTTALSILAGIVFGLPPAFATSRLDLKERASRSGGTYHHRTQRTLVVIEIALALTLLVGAGLTIRSLTSALRVDPGFRTDHLLLARISFPNETFSPDDVLASWRLLGRAFTAVPSVQAVSLSASSVPMTGDFSALPFWLQGEPKPSTPAQMKWALSYVVEPSYLKVMKIPLRRGRFLTTRDTEESPLVIVIDDQFARTYFASQDPIGRRVNFDVLNVTAEVVGVAGHVRQWGLDESTDSPYQTQVYLSMYQLPRSFLPLAASDIAVTFRTAGAPLAAVGPIRRALEQLNGLLVMYREQDMNRLISDRLATRRFSMIVLGIFAGLALLMACLGIYGVISHLVGRRTQEIAIRVALGATRAEILNMVFRDGAKIIAAGIAIGLVVSVGLSRLIASMLFQTSAHDPISIAGVVGLMILVAFSACYFPARDAASLDPMVGLRRE